MRIDAHQHFWALDRGGYGWLTADLKPLYRDFGPADLMPLLAAHDIEGTVLVQASPTRAETDYLLSLADSHAFILGVVGWVDFEAHTAAEQIAHLADHPKLVGLRPMIQDIVDVDWMLHDRLHPAFAAMIEHDLAFDALTLPQHLPNLHRLCAQHPDLRVVIDHGSKPDIRGGEFDAWAANMAQMAEHTNAFVKLSGLVNEAGADWSVPQLTPYVDHILSHFGPDRILWGSDWPVCTLSATYADWTNATTALLSGLHATDRDKILGGTAYSFYQLKGSAS